MICCFCENKVESECYEGDNIIYELYIRCNKCKYYSETILGQTKISYFFDKNIKLINVNDIINDFLSIDIYDNNNIEISQKNKGIYDYPFFKIKVDIVPDPSEIEDFVKRIINLNLFI